MNAPESKKAVMPLPDERPVEVPLPPELKAWCDRLASVGVQCKDIAYQNLAPWGQRSFDGASPTLAAAWATLLERLSPQQPVVLTRHGQDLVMACVMGGDGVQRTVLGCLIAPPHNEKIIQLVQLSLGWLQVSSTTNALVRGTRAMRLLDLMSHVLSHDKARAGAQDWINRTAAWARAQHESAQALSLSLFSVRKGTPKWWVTSDTAWAERGSPALHDELEIAAHAALQTQEQQTQACWAMPLFEQGEVSAVLVARGLPVAPMDDAQSEALAQALRDLLRASAALAEPTLRLWRTSERPLWAHALASLKDVGGKLAQPGHLTWKVGVAASLILLGVLTLWPVDDRVKANVVIEGRVRQIVTAPFEGFLAKVLVRPGDQVKAGQVLAMLDEHELLLEQAKQRSAAEQAEGRLRQAMGQREAAATAQASAELHQAQAQLALVESKLLRAALLAPLDGLVVTGDWAQQIGAPIENGKELFEITAGQGYRVILHVPDGDIARVHEGQSGALRLTGQPGQTHALRVARITATASVEEGVNGFRVEAEWQGQPVPLSPGMQGVGKIVVGQTNLLGLWTRSLVDWARLKLWALW